MLICQHLPRAATAYLHVLQERDAEAHSIEELHTDIIGQIGARLAGHCLEHLAIYHDPRVEVAEMALMEEKRMGWVNKKGGTDKLGVVSLKARGNAVSGNLKSG